MRDADREMLKTRLELGPGKRLHLVGIGGAGMSAIARVLMGRGFVVSGSDQQSNETTTALEADGARIHLGHHPDNVADADVLVVSSAVPPANPEVTAARQLAIPVLKRADLLGYLMEGSYGIAIAGTHGKSTTTGMIAQILMDAGLDPTFMVGGVVPSLGTNGRHGNGKYFVVEADEYDRMFLGLKPRTIVITNIEHDHPDHFPTMDDYLAAFVDFVNVLPARSQLIICTDDPGALRLLREVRSNEVQTTKYGLASPETDMSQAAWYALDWRPNQLGGTDFLVQAEGNVIGLARLRLPGVHNVYNALAATIVARQLGIDFDTIRQSLAEFGGVRRRFQVVGEVRGVTVVDDYAHHPTEIKATLAAARQRFPGRRIWAVWQPHTYSRTRLLAKEFAASFDQADRVVALDIYRSRENDSAGVLDTRIVLDEMKHPDAVYLANRTDAVNYILERLISDDVVLTMSAGDGNLVGEQLLEDLRKRVSED